MKKLIILICLFVAFQSNAQQDALYSQYMFNPFALNPGYAGSRDAISGVLLYRNQWTGFEGAPNTASFAIHSPFKGKNFALGLNGFAETVGPSSNSGVFGTYAYKIRMPKGKLSLGLRGGLYASKFNKNLLNYADQGDQYNTGGVFRAIVPSFDFGAYYYTNKFYVGLASTHLGEFGSQFEDAAQTQLELNQHYIASLGAAFEISDKVVFKPSANTRFVSGVPFNFDINASFLFNKVFWIGASYRSSQSLVFISELNITDFLRIGYAYDMDLSLLKRYNSGSHEIFLGFDFSLRKQKSISPRYL